MSTKQPVPLLGRLAVHLKMISVEQLREALRVQGASNDDRSLGAVLCNFGFLDPAQLEKLVETQKRMIAQEREKAGGDAAPQAGPAPGSAPARPVQQKGAAGPAASARPTSPAAASPPPVSRPAARASAPAGSLDAILRSAVERGASDVHVHTGTPLRQRIAGVLREEGGPLDAQATRAMLLGILDEKGRAQLESRGQIDLCHSIDGVGRFRANLYRQQRGVDGVFRVISARPPTLDELGLPRAVAKLTTYHQGMVLVTGPTGSGKTSTLAALVDLINEERGEHILTIEDPIEYVHPAKRCLINQRSVSHHTASFARALRAALREDPDVIVIGELRDLETISLALTAAETGHLVLATLHTDNTLRTLNRVVGAFPSDQQEQVRTMLSESLRAVLSQRLLPRADGKGRVPALETLIVTKAVGNLIRENKVFQIQSILQTGATHGMGLLDQSIKALVQAGTVKREDALKHISDPKQLAA
jgi:twitching motility protein PilT